jgi:hypothetical protein
MKGLQSTTGGRYHSAMGKEFFIWQSGREASGTFMKHLLFLAICSACFLSSPAPAIASSFTSQVKDGLDRPVAGVTLQIYWLKEESKTNLLQIDLAKAVSDTNGMFRGSFDEKTVPKGENIWLDIGKEGYEGYSQTVDAEIRKEFVVRKVSKPEEMQRIVKLTGQTQVEALREFLGGRCENEDGEADFWFIHESEFRESLRKLVPDPHVWQEATAALATIGVPEDIKFIVQHANGTVDKDEAFTNRWAYPVVSSLLSPSSEEEWAFLKRCAENGFDDLWVDFAGIKSLKLIASPKSLEILKEAEGKNLYRKKAIQRAIQYIESKPPPLEDEDLVTAARKVAETLQIGKWQGNRAPRFNEKRDKALIDCEFIAGQDLLVHTATFHKAGKVWKLRGVRETLQALLAQPLEKSEKEN